MLAAEVAVSGGTGRWGVFAILKRLMKGLTIWRPQRKVFAYANLRIRIVRLFWNRLARSHSKVAPHVGPGVERLHHMRG